MTLAIPKSVPLRVFALLLIAGFLYLQWAYAQHQSQLELHKADHACEWCLVYGQAGHAMAGTAPSIPPATYHLLQHVTAASLHSLDALSFYGARAPPVTLPL